jgi:all-trans-retinol 13,14-reductase
MEYGDRKKLVDSLGELYPEDMDGITHFFNLVGWNQFAFGFFALLKLTPLWLTALLRRTIGKLLLDPFLLPTSQVLASCVKNPYLRGMLTWCWGDYGTSPTQSPFLIHAGLIDHFSKGMRKSCFVYIRPWL